MMVWQSNDSGKFLEPALETEISREKSKEWSQIIDNAALVVSLFGELD